jgi:hypothetical protein
LKSLNHIFDHKYDGVEQELTLIRRFLFSGTLLSSLAGPALADEAQSIGVNLMGLNHYFVDRTNSYQFDETTALSYYTITVVGQVAVSCQRAEEGRCRSTLPKLPAAAAPDPREILKQAEADECTFAKGGKLGSHSFTSPIQHVDVDLSSSEHDRWNFIWVYSVWPAPSKSAPVAPLTAWGLVSSTAGGTAKVTLDAIVASESVVVSQSFPTGKYSFRLATSLSPGVPNQTTNRVHGLMWMIKDATNKVVFQQPGGSTVVDNVPGSRPYDPTTNALDFIYTANAGSYGTASAALIDSNNSASATGTSASDHTPGDARSILNGGLQNGVYHDTLNSNDDGGADGSDLSYAVVSSIQQHLGPGSYTVTLTGSVDDLATSYSQPFSVTKGRIKIITPDDCTH